MSLQTPVFALFAAMLAAAPTTVGYSPSGFFFGLGCFGLGASDGL